MDTTLEQKAIGLERELGLFVFACKQLAEPS